MRQRRQEVAQVRPSARQLAWQQTEFYAFFHFGINTYTNKEWGDGTESPSLFNPVAFDAQQWIDAVKQGEMKGVMLTCKHHDGFCLWPSQYTEHSVKNSPWKKGQGDVVKEVAQACQQAGIKFGIYLSPWDQHEESYGHGERYNRFFMNQLRELLTNYGDIFSVWFDGANGEGVDGKRQVYDWQGYYHLIRELQPLAVISVVGPDVRWIGNEAGKTRKSEWSVVPKYLQDAEKIHEASQHEDSPAFRKRRNSSDEVLGDWSVVVKAEPLSWFPAEVNTSIRPGWFYHPEENNQVKSLADLMRIYLASVGGNASFLLNLAPDKKGRLPQLDCERLEELGEEIRQLSQENMVVTADLSSSVTLGADYSIERVKKKDGLYWSSLEGQEEAVIKIQWQSEQCFNMVELQEHLPLGQRIEAFTLEVFLNNQWHVVYQGTVVGYRKICCFESVRSAKLRVTIDQSRWCPTLSYISVRHYDIPRRA